jgi:hypothetical protein
VVNEHRVDETNPRHSQPVGARLSLEIVVLEVRVLGAKDPTLVVRVGVVGRARLLKDVGSNANARAIAGGHSESQVRALEIELVLSFVRRLTVVLIIPEDNAREIQHGRRRGFGCRSGRVRLGLRRIGLRILCGKRGGQHERSENCDGNSAHLQRPTLMVFRRDSRFAIRLFGSGA